MSIIKDTSSICWDADVSATDLGRVISEKPLPFGTVIKLDQAFFEKCSKEYISALQDAGYLVFVDRKICDTPDKVLQIATSYLKYSPYMLSVMAGICSTGDATANDLGRIDALKRFANLCKTAGTKSCAVTMLPSKTDQMAHEEFSGFSRQEQAAFYAELAMSMEMTDVVCSAEDISYLWSITSVDEKSVEVNASGVRLEEDEDRNWIITPADAFLSGADRIIIGSGLGCSGSFICEYLRRNYDLLLAHLDEYGIAIE